jgi:ribosomal protein S18 acetylase RimI-like enzyme
VGYISVKKQSRGRGLGKRLTESLVKKCKGSLFATTRELNTPIHRILEATGFRKVGEPWPSKERPGESVVLWILKR